MAASLMKAWLFQPFEVFICNEPFIMNHLPLLTDGAPLTSIKYATWHSQLIGEIKMMISYYMN